MPLDPKEAEKALHDVLDRVKRTEPKAEARVTMFSARSANTRYAVNEVTTSGESDETEITLYLALGKRHAEVTTNQTEPAALQAWVTRALSLARVSPEDPEAMPVLGKQTFPVSAAFDEAAAKLTAASRAQMAKQAIDEAKSKDLVIAGFIEHLNGVQAMATSAGVSVAQKVSNVSMTTSARTKDATGSGWAGATARKAAEVDAGKLARTACEKASLSKSPRKLEPGRYTVLLEPAAVGELVGYLFDALDARSADEGRSFFSKTGGGNRIGETVLAPRVTLSTNPSSALTPNITFDPDGLPLPAMTWVDKGVVKALRSTRYWAQKQGTKVMGQYGGFQLDAGTDDFDAMLKGIKRGVLITRFWYSNFVDPQTLMVTGLTRDGTFLVEDGKVVSAVNNFRFNESVAKVFERADALGKDSLLVGRADTRCPAVRTHEFNLASVSDAV